MNLCLKCHSLYTNPGTCNCFADGSQQPAVVPTQPWTPDYPNWSWPTTPTPTYEHPWVSNNLGGDASMSVVVS